MSDITASPRGPIGVGFVGSIGRTCFSDLLLRACPRLETAYRTGSRAALLTAVGSRRLDIAIYPGAPATGLGTMLLCEDHVVVAARRGHRLVGGSPIPVALLPDSRLLLPVEGEESDFRRLVLGLVPGIGRVVEMPIRDIGPRLLATDMLALVAAGQRDELGAAIVTVPIAARDTRFPVQMSWAADGRHQEWRALLVELTENRTTLSSLAAEPIISSAGGRDDDSGGGDGASTLG